MKLTNRQKATILESLDRVCSGREAEEAFDLLGRNRWDFDEENRARTTLDSIISNFNPNQLAALITIKNYSLYLPYLAYSLGKMVRNASTEYDGDTPSDHAIERMAPGPREGALMEAYSFNNRISAALDKLIGLSLGVPLAPITFMVGLCYTPRNQQENG